MIAWKIKPSSETELISTGVLPQILRSEMTCLLRVSSPIFNIYMLLLVNPLINKFAKYYCHSLLSLVTLLDFLWNLSVKPNRLSY